MNEFKTKDLYFDTEVTILPINKDFSFQIGQDTLDFDKLFDIKEDIQEKFDKISETIPEETMLFNTIIFTAISFSAVTVHEKFKNAEFADSKKSFLLGFDVLSSKIKYSFNDNLYYSELNSDNLKNCFI